MKHSITIRQATLKDLPVLLDFEQAIIEYERPFEEQMQNEKFHYYDIAKLIESDNAEVLVACIDEKVIASGYAAIKKSLNYLKDEFHSFLGFMYVASEHRGKGINQKLIKQLIVWSQTKKMTSVSLTVFGDNASAIRAYEKLGFKHQLIEMRLNLE